MPPVRCFDNQRIAQNNVWKGIVKTGEEYGQCDNVLIS